jgi:hypothetical protein
VHKPDRSSSSASQASRTQRLAGLVAGALVLCIAVVALALKALARGAFKNTQALGRRGAEPSSPPLGWIAQTVLGISFAVTIAGAVALADDEPAVYPIVVTATLGACLLGLAYRSSFIGLACGSVAAAALAVVLFAAGIPWPLLGPTLIVALALLWAPTTLSQHTGALWTRVAVVVAVTSAAIAATFYVRGTPETSLALAVTTVHHEPGPSLYLVELLNFEGCESPVTADIYWGMSPPFHWVAGGGRKADRASAMLTAWADSQVVLGVGANTILVEPFEDESLLQTGNPVGAPRVLKYLQPVARGIGSCYLVLPRLVGPDAASFYSGVMGALPLKSAVNELSLDGAGLSVARGNGPTYTGDPSRWQCSSEGEYTLAPSGLAPAAPGSDCGAVLILTDRWYQTFQNVMLLIIGGLFAALVALIGHAITGSRQAAEQ